MRIDSEVKRQIVRIDPMLGGPWDTGPKKACSVYFGGNNCKIRGSNRS